MASVGRLFARLLLGLPVALLSAEPPPLPQLPLSLLADDQLVDNKVPTGTTNLKLAEAWKFQHFPPITHLSVLVPVKHPVRRMQKVVEASSSPPTQPLPPSSSSAGKVAHNTAELEKEEVLKAVAEDALNKGLVVTFATIPLDSHGDEGTDQMAMVQLDLISSGAKTLANLLGCVKEQVDIEEGLEITRALVKPLQEMHKLGLGYGSIDMDKILVVGAKQCSSGDTADPAAESQPGSPKPPTSADLGSPSELWWENHRSVQIMAEKTKLFLTDFRNGKTYVPGKHEEVAYRDIRYILLFLCNVDFRNHGRLHSVKAHLEKSLRGGFVTEASRLATYSQIGLIDYGFGDGDTDFGKMTPAAKSMWMFVTRALLPVDLLEGQTFEQMVAPLYNGGIVGKDDVSLLFLYAQAMHEKHSNWWDDYIEIIKELLPAKEVQSRTQRRDINLFYRAIGKFQATEIAEHKALHKALNVAFNFTYMFALIKDRLPEQTVEIDLNSVVWRWIKKEDKDGIITTNIKKRM
eukprot:GHVS01023567.1.p1 GENE.GHVS01023567.1~~GHVS01023567.1.p1  ORF type:complete len:519 (+),score=69.64 GHVS01023567.1:119-1675(+)